MLPTTANEPTTLFVHGVAMCPSHFSVVQANVTSSTLTWTRPGYDNSKPSANWDSQVDELCTKIESIQPAVVAGVSGGATLALAAALRAPEGLQLAICHEPLIGKLEPVLDDVVQQSARRLASAKLKDYQPEVHRFLVGLYGPSWERQPPHFQEWIRTNIDTVGRDVTQFSTFQPALDHLRSIEVPLITTVGSTSPPHRHRVAKLLGSLGATVHEIEHAGHLVTIEQPERFASIVNTHINDGDVHVY